MNLEEVLSALDLLVFTKTGKHLKEVETAIFRGAWQGKTYEQIVEENSYSLTYIKQAAGPRLWKLLTKVLGENVSKTNLRSVVERRWESILGSLPSLFKNSAASLAQQPSARTVSPSTMRDWGEAPDVSIFYGRDRELELLEGWIVGDRCRVIAIVGMAGIGKTALSVTCAQRVEGDFEYVIWRSLHHAAEEHFALKMLESIPFPDAEGQSATEDPISQLVELLQQHRCLLLLENVETIMRSGELAGCYQQQYDDYRELIQKLATIPHQSCLILTSREQLKEIALLAGETTPVRSLALKGLGEDAKKILSAKNLSNENRWDELIQLYRGNPLALKIVSNTIRELFGGQVATFLQQQTIIFGDLSDLLDEQFERLSSSEAEILYWLAIESKALSVAQLFSNPRFPLTAAEIMAVLESLLRRSLIDKNIVDGEVLFALQQPVVAQYIIDRAIAQICQEIQAVSKSKDLKNLKLLKNYHLQSHADLDEPSPKLLTLASIVQKLYSIYRSQQVIAQKLRQISDLFAEQSAVEMGYAPQNIQRLLELNKESETQKILDYSPGL